MKNFLLLFLFTYTGGIVDFIYETAATHTTFYKELSSTARTARGFLLSAICTVLSVEYLHLCGVEGMNSLEGVVTTLSTTGVVWQYLIVSIVMAAACAGVWLGAQFGRVWIHNKHVDKSGKGYINSKKLTTWEDFACSPKDFDAKQCAILIYRGDRLVTAGLFWALSDDFSKDKGFVLQWCDEVKEEMKRPEDECLIGSDMATYYDVATDTRVEMRDAVAFIDKINKKVAEKRAKERAKG